MERGTRRPVQLAERGHQPALYIHFDNNRSTFTSVCVCINVCVYVWVRWECMGEFELPNLLYAFVHVRNASLCQFFKFVCVCVCDPFPFFSHTYTNIKHLSSQDRVCARRQNITTSTGRKENKLVNSTEDQVELPNKARVAKPFRTAPQVIWSNWMSAPSFKYSSPHTHTSYVLYIQVSGTYDIQHCSPEL